MPKMTPIDRLLGIPASLFAALDHLPAIARNTSRMEDHTANLRDMTTILAKVAADTRALPELRKSMNKMAETTSVLGPMDDRMANIEKTMPILVEVQRHLAQLPETIEALDTRIEKLSNVLERMLDTMTHLDGAVSDLQGAVEPVGRLASRLPGQKTASR